MASIDHEERQQMHLHDELTVVVNLQDLIVPIQKPAENRPVDVLDISVDLAEQLVGGAVSDLLAQREERGVPRRELDLHVVAPHTGQPVGAGEREMRRQVPEEPRDLVRVDRQAVLAPAADFSPQQAGDFPQQQLGVQEGNGFCDPLPLSGVSGVAAPLRENLPRLRQESIRRNGSQRREGDEPVRAEVIPDIQRQMLREDLVIVLDDLA